MRSQSIDLTKEGLDRLRDLSSSSDLAPRIRHLELIYIYYHETPADPDHPDTTFPDEPIFPRRDLWCLNSLRFPDDPEDRKWMDDRQAEQFALTGATMCVQLSDALRAFGSLDKITLEAVVVLGRQPEHRWPPHKVEYLAWKELWSRAIQAYRVVMSAIARSQIHLNSLVIYEWTKICSIPCNEAVAVVPRIIQQGFAAVGSHLNNFSISLATKLTPVVPIKDDDDFYEPLDLSSDQILPSSGSTLDDESEFQDMARLLQLMPNLKSLAMHLYRTFRDEESFFNSYSSLLSVLFRCMALPHLRSLNLRGFPAQKTLINDILLTYPSIRYLALVYMRFKPDEWAGAFSPLANTHSSVRTLRLSDIWSSGPRERFTVDVTQSVARNLMAANPRKMHLVSDREQRSDVNKEMTLCIEINPESGWAVAGGLASHRDWVGVANWVLECGPPTNYG
ncbi:hypothetical protein FDECE_8050 [Fusarium decemcellulare]|nr:hypothetical protein FDECE_8050 [Fusarium decemcellulare]